MATYVQTIGSSSQAPEKLRNSVLGWKTIAWFSLLVGAVYTPVLSGLARQWATDADMGHGFLVPCVAGYIAWQRRAEWARLTPVPNYGGLALVAWGAAQMILGNLAAQLFITRTAFLVSVVGIVLFLDGAPAVRVLAFPLFVLIFLFPVPAMLYAQITLPLQIFASSVAEAVLNWIGIPVLRDGNILELARQRISVVEACSGMRSLLSLAFLSLIYAYFFDPKIWMRGLLLAVTIPVAIAANAARVTVTGIVSSFRPELAQGPYHVLEGWVLFLSALTLMVVIHRCVQRVSRVLNRTWPTGIAIEPPLPHRYPAIDTIARVGTLSSWPTVCLTATLLFQGLLFYGFSSTEAAAASRPLDGFPFALGPWHMLQQSAIPQDVKDVLRADDYLTRQYASSPAQTANLFVASFKTQRTGQTPHSPKNCLPGSGWVWSVADTIRVRVADRAHPIEINRYIVSKDDSRAVVLYWYQSRDRVVASEYKAAAFAAFDAIRYHRTDTALVRVVVPVTSNLTDQATHTGIEFIQAFFPALSQFLPS